MKCTERDCVNQHLGVCEIKSTVTELGLCEDFDEGSDENKESQLCFEF